MIATTYLELAVARSPHTRDFIDHFTQQFCDLGVGGAPPCSAQEACEAQRCYVWTLIQLHKELNPRMPTAKCSYRLSCILSSVKAYLKHYYKTVRHF